MGTPRFSFLLKTVLILILVLPFAGCGGGGGGGKSAGAAEEQSTTVTVTGRILDKDHNPIANATVTIESTPVIVQTDRWGEFSAKVETGEHTITITKDNITLYQNTFTAQTGFTAVDLGDLTPNYASGEGNSSGGTSSGSGSGSSSGSSSSNSSSGGSSGGSSSG
ncbi:MAG TPA: carboxypeptidase regulatory-like domain-containing protein, partial [Desulfomonilia bacterium]|nr:carboxypeptidase regulatory-like domain-containing protein [Desulfomonilia bacterium]